MTNMTAKYSRCYHPRHFPHPNPRYGLWVGRMIRFLQFLSTPKVRFSIFLFLFYVIPYFVSWAMQWDITYSHILVTTFFVGLLGYAVRQYPKGRKIGFRLDTLKSAFLWFGGTTLFFMLVIFITANSHVLRVAPHPASQDWVSTLAVYCLIFTPSQELVHRGLLFAEMKRAGIVNSWAQILISSATFAFAHIHFRDGWTLLITFAISLVWASIYKRHPNWLMITIAHAILGSVALLMHLV